MVLISPYLLPWIISNTILIKKGTECLFLVVVKKWDIGRNVEMHASLGEGENPKG